VSGPLRTWRLAGERTEGLEGHRGQRRPRLEGGGWLFVWQEHGGRKPVKEWCSGADWITRSFEKVAADGAVMDRPGGGPFLRDVEGVL
jgi:hypothetical protein